MVHDQELADVGGNLQPVLAEGLELSANAGFVFEVRSAGEQDEAPLAKFFTHVAEDDLRSGFLSAVLKVGHTRSRQR